MSRRRFRCTPEGLVEIGYETDAPRVAPDVMGDLPAYHSPIDGRLVDGRAARRDDLKRHKCRPYEQGEREEADRRRAAEDRQLESRVGETVERWWAHASGDKREALAKALEMGFDARTVRMGK